PDGRASGTPVASLVEGRGCKVTRVEASTDLSDLVNEVTVTSGALKDEDGNDLEPISATARDDDRTSPTWVGHGHIMRAPTVTSDEVTTLEQAKELAAARLAELRTPI